MNGERSRARYTGNNTRLDAFINFIKHTFRRNRAFLYWYPAMIIYMEIVFHISIYFSTKNSFGAMSVVYIILFSAALGCFLTIASTIFVRKINVFVVYAIMIFITLVFEVQIVYFGQFKDYFLWSTLGLADDVTDFCREALVAIWKNIVTVLLLLVPIIIYSVWGRKNAPALGTPVRVKLTLLIVGLIFQLLGTAFVVVDETANMYYSETFSTSQSVGYFGVMTETRLDIKYLITGGPESDNDLTTIDSDLNPFSTTASSGSDTTSGTDSTGSSVSSDDGTADDTTATEVETPVEYGYNVLDIDFDVLIAGETNDTIIEMHEYFSSLSPTQQNEYTGYFEGKNLIYMTLEGFTSACVTEELFPTLYKMLNEGFVLENYYNSLWGGSTATGEYVNLTGLFYNSAQCLTMSAENYWPYSPGNVFNALGYSSVYAFHNHTYTYYGRNLSHPNFGFKYLAVGNGLDNLTYYWPRSDLEMAEQTIDYYINNTPFLAYYMTVSGHANYSFSGNAMSKLHADEVADLDYSDEVKAYIACQLEVEYMLEYLVEALDEAGILEDTVFVMSADHYPYALSDSALAELYGLDENGIHGNFDLFRNGAVIWCASMEEPVYIEKPCSTIDLLPTILNLFGVSYDSRLLMGVDLNSSTDPLVILNRDSGYPSWNWINAYGSYNTSTKEFTAAEGVIVDDSVISTYVSQMNSIVSTKRKYSFRILDYDYYSYVFENISPYG
ncbi:MAG: sulfatase-like hydrolase/transferase [Firmicutes bacterium]|nr:sulfatase-like hydrolase/transferase [Bacillota bacterium]